VTAAPEQAGAVEMLEGLKDWTVRRALATPQFYIIVTGYTTYQLINTTAHGFAVEHLTERGVSAKAAAAMLSVEALIGAAVSVLGGVIGEKVPAKFLMVVSLTALTLGMAGLAEATDWTLMWVYAVGVGIGFGLSLLAGTMMLYQYYGKRPNLELYSIMCLISTSAAIGPTLGGWARDTLGSFTGMFLVCGAGSTVLALATLLMRKPAHRTGQASVPVGEGAQ
jgi:MFS family permease